jgi:formate--tetrahydrofolate ligase
MKSDIEIARETALLPIQKIAQSIQIPEEELIPYGKYIAKVPIELIEPEKIKKNHLILVTAITPTKAGIGKTTTTVGLVLGLNLLGKKAIAVLREPSLGPCFGMKGGAAGGGYAQVLPMEAINLHFTGDFHAITTAHNMISALLDNYQFQNRNTDKQLKQIVWKRVLDINDRSLRQIISGLGGNTNGLPTETGFDITPASEIMAILCLATNLEDLRQRIEAIILGYDFSNKLFTVKDLGVAGAITVLLKDAILPNLVQTTENTPAIVHGGPFANIAHGCNSILATQLGLTFGEYAVTEAGFGADLGAEKFFNIKCRVANLQPKATVLVTTSQALKLHGGVAESEISKPNLAGLQKGLENLQKHIENLLEFGQNIIVAFNQYHFDTPEEMDFLRDWCTRKGVKFALNNSFAEGGKGAVELAKAVIETIENQSFKPLNFTYPLEESIENKISLIAQKVYGAKAVDFDKKALTGINRIKKLQLTHLPICIAKTQYSFSDNPQALGMVKDFTIKIDDIVINSGAGFIVAIAGQMMRMPGLPEVPQAQHIDIINGEIVGLS